MGTNFYIYQERPTHREPQYDSMDPEYHVGKRSAAGMYCWDCDITLCKGRVHYGDEFHDRCPTCGKKPKKYDALSKGPAAVELGFAEPETKRPTGVQGCSSFTWAQPKESVVAACKARPDEELIIDEYGRTLTGQEFLDMLENNCPLQFFDSIGKWFS
jgi:hypothetical protein